MLDLYFNRFQPAKDYLTSFTSLKVIIKRELTNVSNCLWPCFLNAKWLRIYLMNLRTSKSSGVGQSIGLMKSLNEVSEISPRFFFRFFFKLTPYHLFLTGRGHYPGSGQFSYNNWSPPAQSNETANGYFLERSHSARLTLEKACELLPDEVRHQSH